MTPRRNEQGLTEAEQAGLSGGTEEIEKLPVYSSQGIPGIRRVDLQGDQNMGRGEKEKNFKKFAPVLKDIVGYQKKFASYRAKDGEKLYNVMLDSYEKVSIWKRSTVSLTN